MKIVLIGAGSFVFSLSVLHDLIAGHRLAGSELALVDLDPQILPVMAGIGRRMAADCGVEIRISTTTDRAESLPGADFVILCAEVQGGRRWRMDYEIISRAGIPDQARECAGLGGMIHAFRSIALALDVARDMERHCPGATLLDVTNPMPRVVTAVSRFTAIRAIGFCNVAWGGYPGYQALAGMVGRAPGEISVVTAGLNHFAWLLALHDRRTGEDLYPLVQERIEQGEGRESLLLRRWLRQYGGIGVSGVEHMGEYLPFDPDNHYCDRPPFHGDSAERRRHIERLEAAARGARDWRDLLASRSWERPLDMAVALGLGREMDFEMVNIPNQGALSQLPAGRIVEVPAAARGGELRGVVVPPMPEPLAALCRSVSDVIELTAEAAAKGDRALARQAIEVDPAISDKPAAHRILEELIQAHADILPAFG